MKSRFYLLTLLLVFALASFTIVSAEDKAADSENQSAPAAVEEATPAVPDNGTLKDDAEDKAADSENQSAPAAVEEATPAVPENGTLKDDAEDKAADSENQPEPAAVEEAIPDVPENGTLKDDAEDKAADSENQPEPAAVEEAIPDVPENGTLKDYQEYISSLKKSYQKMTQSMIAQAIKNGVNPRSEEFSNSSKAMTKEYAVRIGQAADKAMLLKDVSDEEFEQMAGNKLQIIQLMGQINNEDKSAVNAKLEAFAAQLREMGKAKLADNIEGKLLQNKIIGYIRSGSVEEFSKIAAETDEKIEKAGKDVTPPLAIQAMLIVLGAKDLAEYKAPEGRLDKYLTVLSEASDPEVKKIAGNLERAIIRSEGDKRFNDSLGNEFKFSGTFTDGSEYKAEDYAGKVVLIDFWATWCGPCCRELPNVKKIYNAFHDKGFEVIGVTCDDPKEEEDFNKFLKDKEIPWKQMFDGKAVVPGLKTKSGEPVPVSDYYAINGIPCPVLIGKDGKVISLNARGKELKDQLVKIYGEVEGLDAVEEAGELLDVYDDEDAEDEEDLEEDDQAADEAIPDVPENGTLAEYREYFEKVNGMLNKKVRSFMRQAKKDGVDLKSDEYANSLKKLSKEYYSRMDQAIDKTLLLKDLSDDEFGGIVETKIQLIQIMTDLNNEDASAAFAKIEAFAAQLRKMGKAEIANDIENALFRNKVVTYIQTGKVEEFAKAAAEIDEKVKKAGKDITPDLAQMAILIVMGSKELAEYKAPEGRNDNYLKAFSEASNPEVNEFVDVLKTVINLKKDEDLKKDEE